MVEIGFAHFCAPLLNYNAPANPPPPLAVPCRGGLEARPPTCIRCPEASAGAALRLLFPADTRPSWAVFRFVLAGYVGRLRVVNLQPNTHVHAAPRQDLVASGDRDDVQWGLELAEAMLADDGALVVWMGIRC